MIAIVEDIKAGNVYVMDISTRNTGWQPVGYQPLPDEFKVSIASSRLRRYGCIIGTLGGQYHEIVSIKLAIGGENVPLVDEEIKVIKHFCSQFKFWEREEMKKLRRVFEALAQGPRMDSQEISFFCELIKQHNLQNVAIVAIDTEFNERKERWTNRVKCIEFDKGKTLWFNGENWELS